MGGSREILASESRGLGNEVVRSLLLRDGFIFRSDDNNEVADDRRGNGGWSEIFVNDSRSLVIGSVWSWMLWGDLERWVNDNDGRGNLSIDGLILGDFSYFFIIIIVDDNLHFLFLNEDI